MLLNFYYYFEYLMTICLKVRNGLSHVGFCLAISMGSTVLPVHYRACGDLMEIQIAIWSPDETP